MISQASSTKRLKKVVSSSDQLDSLKSSKLAPPLFEEEKCSYVFQIFTIYLVVNLICRHKLSKKALYMVTPKSGESSDKRSVIYDYFCFTLIFPFWCQYSRLQRTTAKKDVNHQQKSNPTKTEVMPVTLLQNSNKCVCKISCPLAFINVANLLPERQQLLLLSRRSMSHMKIHLPCLHSRLQRPKGRALHKCPPQLM